MFLSIVRLPRALRRIRDDEAGVALPTVIIFMFAGVLLSLVVASTVMYSYTFSSSTRASVQSQASAEAGIAAARAGLLEGSCSDTNGVFAGADPAFEAQVYKPDGTGGWIAGCPADPSQSARIIATGWAAAKGVNGDATGDVAKIEAILGGVGDTSALFASGPAIYAYDAAGFGGSGTLLSADGTIADVMLHKGDVNCNGGAAGAVQLVIKSGNFIGGGSCTVHGSLWVNGDVTLNGGANIHGSITGRNVTVAANTVGGNIWADQTFTGKWSTPIGGWVSADNVNVDGSRIAGDVWARSAGGLLSVTGSDVQGAIHASGNFTITGGSVMGGQVAGVGCFRGGSIKGAVVAGSVSTSGGCKTNISGGGSMTVGSSVLPPSPLKPTAPTVPQWVDFGSKAEHYTSAGWPGFTVYKMTGPTCKEGQFLAALQAIGDSPGVIDARNCPNGIETFSGSATTYYEDSPQNGHHAWRVRNDLAIISSKFPLGNGSLNGVGGTHDVWFIVPDVVANGEPSCQPGSASDMAVNGGVKFNDVNVMIYSPCKVTIESRVAFNGQMFTHFASVAGDAHITYTAVGLPGFDLDEGTETGPSATEWDRQILSQRNIAG